MVFLAIIEQLVSKSVRKKKREILVYFARDSFSLSLIQRLSVWLWTSY